MLDKKRYFLIWGSDVGIKFRRNGRRKDDVMSGAFGGRERAVHVCAEWDIVGLSDTIDKTTMIRNNMVRCNDSDNMLEIIRKLLLFWQVRRG